MKNTVLITGGSQRIGAVISERIAREGWNVIIHYNKSRNKAFNLKKKLSLELGYIISATKIVCSKSRMALVCFGPNKMFFPDIFKLFSAK